MFGVYTPNTPMCHSSGSERRALRFQTPAWLSAHSLPLTRQVLALMKVFFFFLPCFFLFFCFKPLGKFYLLPKDLGALRDPES